MSYNYANSRPYVFTEEGQKTFLQIRDKAKYLLKEAGAFNMSCVLKDASGGSSWDLTACVDRLVELGEIVELTDNTHWGQYRVFYDGKKHNR